MNQNSEWWIGFEARSTGIHCGTMLHYIPHTNQQERNAYS